MKKIVVLGISSTLLIGFCALPIYATDIDTATSEVLYDSEIDVVNIGSGDISSELSTTESSKLVEDSIENIESDTFEMATQEESESGGNQEQESDSPDSKEMLQEIEIPDFDEEQIYPSRRSDLTTSPTTFSTFASIPKVSAADINLPDKNFIDVASWNGEISVEEYRTIKSYGVTGVVVKLTEATSYQNPFAEKQVANALAAGLKVSVYHYSWFTDKNSARLEADYFAKMANRLKLPKDTMMVNDIEEPQIANNKNHTDNSKEFEKRLGELGFTNVNHYVGLNWINVGLIDPVSLDKTKMWVAAYPYTLNTTNRYTEYGAWQWSSRLSFPGVTGEFDISADYAQSYSKNSDTQNKTESKVGPYQSYGKYITIKSPNYEIWQNFSWQKRNHSSNYNGQTLQARGYYQHTNGSRYLSLYDNKGNWIGYINETGTKLGKNRGGAYQSYGKYVTIKSPNYDIWQNFNWQKRAKSSTYIGQTLQARGYYQHFNGARYLSLSDNKGNWVGYINETGTKLGNNQGGAYQSYGKNIMIKSPNYEIWQNFGWQKRNHFSKYYGQILEARGYYNHFNGSRYLSLYDNKGNWIGYINESGTKLMN